MSKLIINCETGETTERELNAEEIAQQVKDEAKYNKIQTQRRAEAEAKEIAKLVLLEKLGITEDEAKLLLS